MASSCATPIPQKDEKSKTKKHKIKLNRRADEDSLWWKDVGEAVLFSVVFMSLGICMGIAYNEAKHQGTL